MAQSVFIISQIFKLIKKQKDLKMKNKIIKLIAHCEERLVDLNAQITNIDECFKISTMEMTTRLLQQRMDVLVTHKYEVSLIIAKLKNTI